MRNDGSVERVADDLDFPNGIALLHERRTLVVAESYASCLTAFDVGDDGSLHNRRTWAALDGAAPDGICVDPSGAIWFTDVAGRRCVHVREGGEVLDVVEADRGCFSCALGGATGTTLFIAAAQVPDVFSAAGSGQVIAVDLDDAGHAANAAWWHESRET